VSALNKILLVKCIFASCYASEVVMSDNTEFNHL